MKILFVTNMPPAYPTNGAIIQTHHFMRLLLKNHQVALWTYSTEDPKSVDLGPMADQLSAVHIEPKKISKDLGGKIKRWLRWISGADPMARWSYLGDRVQKSVLTMAQEFQPDVIVFEQLHMSYPILELSKLPSRPLLAFNAHDAIQVVLRRSYEQDNSNFLESLLNQHFLRVIKSFEHRVVTHADIVFSVSEVDAKHLKTEKLAKDWAVTPNGVDTEYYQPLSDPGDHQSPTLVFIGSLSYGPNLEAIEYYVQQIHDKLRERFPHLMLKIIGRPSEVTKKWEGIPGVEFVGFHRDFRKFFTEAHISIVPLLSGSGTRFKILESWSMAKPVVSTSVGAEGLAYQHDENILIGDDPDSFVEQVTRLLKDSSLREQLAAAGRKTAEQNYSWNSIVDTLEMKLKSHIGEKQHAHRN